MDKKELMREVIYSNLTDDAKYEIITLIFKEDAQKAQPVFVPYTINTPIHISPVSILETPWWKEITCGEKEALKDLGVKWDDGNWWQQQMENARADVESITNPTITWNSKSACEN